MCCVGFAALHIAFVMYCFLICQLALYAHLPFIITIYHSSYKFVIYMFLFVYLYIAIRETNHGLKNNTTMENLNEFGAKEINVNEESLRSILKVELENARDFNLQGGYRIPIYVDEEGNCTSGGWLSQNCYQPNAEELPKVVERWTMSDRGYHGEFVTGDLEEGQEGYNQDDIDYEIGEIIDWYIDNVLLEDERHLPDRVYALC